MFLAFVVTIATLSSVLFNTVNSAYPCTEIISVQEVLLSGTTADLSEFAGDYYFAGIRSDSDIGIATPKYLHSSGAFFSVDNYVASDGTILYPAISFTVPGFYNPDDGQTFGQFTWVSTQYFGGEIVSIDDSCDSSSNPLGIFNVYGGDEPDIFQDCSCNPVFNGDSTIDPYDWYFAAYSPIRIISTFDDCDNLGFDIIEPPPPTPSPTIEPTTSTSPGCPNFNSNPYGSGKCTEDNNCNDACNLYGNNNCQSCDNGSFRLAYNHFCQDCSIIDNCISCSDYQGCTACDNGMNPTWGQCTGFNGAVCR